MDAAYASDDDSVTNESDVGSSEDEITDEMDNKADFDFDDAAFLGLVRW